MTSYPGQEAAAGGARSAEEALQLARDMVGLTPQAAALGIEIVKIENGIVHGRTPYRAELVGDPDTGVIAGGVLTTFLDQISGVAAINASDFAGAVATLDLRIDYMRAATPGRDILAEAQCIRLTRSIAFIRATAFEDSPDNPIAVAMAAFMLAGGKAP